MLLYWWNMFTTFHNNKIRAFPARIPTKISTVWTLISCASHSLHFLPIVYAFGGRQCPRVACNIGASIKTYTHARGERWWVREVGSAIDSQISLPCPNSGVRKHIWCFRRALPGTQYHPPSPFWCLCGGQRPQNTISRLCVCQCKFSLALTSSISMISSSDSQQASLLFRSSSWSSNSKTSAML